MFKNKIQQLAEKLVAANYVIAFTGAGISTESGIPDFRSNGGVWEKIDPEMLSVRTLKNNPELFYRYYREMDKTIKGKEPNAGHYAIAELSRLRVIRAVVTQNIDGLHQKAGSRRVFEVHGNLNSASCLECKHEYSYDLIRERLSEKQDIPLSPCCRKPLRPSIVFFGDKMAADFAAAREEALRSDYVIVVGTSLTVYPAAEIPQICGRFAIINKGETALDHQAEMIINADISGVLGELVGQVKAIRNAES